MKTRIFGLVAVLLATTLTTLAFAHARSVSWSSWTLDGRLVTVRVRIARLDASAVPTLALASASPAPLSPEDESALSGYLLRHLTLRAGSLPCPLEDGTYRVLPSADGFLVREWQLRCPGRGAPRVTSRLFDAELPSHLHIARLMRRGATVAERLMTRDADAWSVGEVTSTTPPQTSSALDFMVLGARHVASGADHIVFVLALVFAARSLGMVAGIVTGFTLGHSLTLALCVLGAVRPDSAVIEALIGGSIVVVAVENVWLVRRDVWLLRTCTVLLVALALFSWFGGGVAATSLTGLALFVGCYFGLVKRSDSPERLRGVVAALFGLVHGLAFAEVLAELELPRSRLVGALVGFNVGVEVAQLVLVALAWPVIVWLSRTKHRDAVLELASSVALAAGAFWLVGRVLAG